MSAKLTDLVYHTGLICTENKDWYIAQEICQTFVVNKTGGIVCIDTSNEKGDETQSERKIYA
ncbi:hypothetical protein GCM10028804_24410 [Larkinella terrae]